MNILLTNGDGCQADGLATMRDALISAGFNVLTVAPERRGPMLSKACSGDTPVRMERSGGNDRHPIFTVAGTAADCVRIAILSGLAREVSAVISGIGEGLDIGDDVTSSATFGAAMEGALLGYPAMAISQQANDECSDRDGQGGFDFNWASVVGGELAAWMGASPPPDRSVINVNVPRRLTDRHLKLTTLAERIWNPADCRQVETADGTGWVAPMPVGDPLQFTMGPGSDALAIAGGHVSITPLSMDFANRRSAVRLRKWTRAVIGEVEPRLGASRGACMAGCCG